MMTVDKIFENIKIKKSYLCIGLDSDFEKLPEIVLNFTDPVFEFNKQIIDATANYAVAYKINTAFYEAYGTKGWISLEKTAHYIKQKFPDIFLIADAKRADIGNTSKMYAKTFFENLPFDSVTVSPYMGSDSVLPFLSYNNKIVILLALTSNSGAQDFQFLRNKNSDNNLFEEVIKKSQDWGNANNLMYVVGATKAEYLQQIRKTAPDNFLLIPGVGEQGGSLKDVSRFGMNAKCGIIVNSSRGIIFADNTSYFAHTAKEKAHEIQTEMAEYLAEII